MCVVWLGWLHSYGQWMVMDVTVNAVLDALICAAVICLPIIADVMWWQDRLSLVVFEVCCYAGILITTIMSCMGIYVPVLLFVIKIITWILPLNFVKKHFRTWTDIIHIWIPWMLKKVEITFFAVTYSFPIEDNMFKYFLICSKQWKVIQICLKLFKNVTFV